MTQSEAETAIFLRDFLACYHRLIPEVTNEDLERRLRVFFTARDELGTYIEARGVPKRLLYLRTEDAVGELSKALKRQGRVEEKRF